jgi:hypothetical protein
MKNLKLPADFLMLFLGMPYEIKLNDLPAGYAIKGAPKGGQVTVCFRKFFSSEDGQELIHHLEKLSMDDAIPSIRDSVLSTLAERLPDWEKDTVI